MKTSWCLINAPAFLAGSRGCEKCWRVIKFHTAQGGFERIAEENS